MRKNTSGKKSKPDPFQLKKQAEEVLRENPERALELICQAEKLATHSIPIKDLKVKCLLRLQRLNQALRLAEKLLKISGRSFDFFRLAKVYFMRGELDLAENAAKQCLMLDQNPAVCALLAKIHYSKGWWDSAEMMINHAIKFDAQQKHLDTNLLMLAQIKRKKQEYAQALRILSQMSESSKKWINARLCRAFCYFEMKKYNSAIAIFLEMERILKQKPSHSIFDHRFRIYTGLIFVYEKLHESGQIIQPYIKGIAERAAAWLREQNRSRLGKYQNLDFSNSLKIIERLQIL